MSENYKDSDWIVSHLKNFCIDSDEANYVLEHKYRFAYMLGDIIPKLAPGIKVANIGLSIIDPLINEIISSYPAIYECLVPDNQFIEYFSQNPNYQNIALEIYDVTKNNANKNDVVMEKYDIVLFYETMEHLMAPDEMILANITKILKHGGLLLGSVPNAARAVARLNILEGRNIFWPKTRIINGVFNGWGHIREYTFSEMSELLSKYFEVQEMTGYSPYERNWVRAILNHLPSGFRDIISFEAKRK